MLRLRMADWFDPVYSPGYPVWAARHESDPVRRDLARELLTAEHRAAEYERQLRAKRKKLRDAAQQQGSPTSMVGTRARPEADA